ncbi:MAG: hypothetical protein ACNA7J_04265 [Wenzhouxiangella sp.]
MRIKLISPLLLASAMALSSVPAHAVDAETVDRLTDFYQLMNGDEWYRDDGWLSPDSDPCDWYGIECFDNQQGEPEIRNIRLSDNNLRGSLANSGILDLSLKVLDLSHNRIHGSLPQLPDVSLLNLSNNRLSGSLPTASGAAPGAVPAIDLSRNGFEGEVPASWSELGLIRLNLADNRLNGLPEAAFLALDETNNSWQLFLEDNDFAGELPEWLSGLTLAGEHSLNLCWNAFTISDDDVLEWVQARHVGGADLSCLGLDRRHPDPELSGSWYNPARDGEGFSLMLLENDSALLYWFSHISKGRQKWLFQVAPIENESLIFDGMHRTEGVFDQGFGEMGRFWTLGSRLRLDWLNSGILHGEYGIQYNRDDLIRESGLPIIHVPIPKMIFRQDHTHLTRLAGSRCDNTHPMQWASGAWYNEERGGEGFLVEVIEDGRGLVYWFTHTPADAFNADEQAWMIGVGQFQGQQLVIENLVQPRDLDNGMPEDTAGITALQWGEIIIDFHDPLTASLQYISEEEDYGSGQYPLNRLARARLADCSAD